MQLEILGSAGAWAHPQSSASSGYILSWDQTRLLIDCGHGVVGKMLGEHAKCVPPTDIYISHHHADHCADLVSLAYAFKFGPWREAAAPNLYCHPDTYEGLKQVVAAHGGADALAGLNYIPVTEAFEIGRKSAEMFLVPHLIPTWAIRIGTFAYSADTGPEPNPAWAQDARTLLCEAAMPPAWPESVDFHLTPTEAGNIATGAGIEHLILTHLPWLDEHYEPLTLQDCRAHFSGKLSIAKPGQVYQIS